MIRSFGGLNNLEDNNAVKSRAKNIANVFIEKFKAHSKFVRVQKELTKQVICRKIDQLQSERSIIDEDMKIFIQRLENNTKDNKRLQELTMLSITLANLLENGKATGKINELGQLHVHGHVGFLLSETCIYPCSCPCFNEELQFNSYLQKTKQAFQQLENSKSTIDVHHKIFKECLA